MFETQVPDVQWRSPSHTMARLRTEKREQARLRRTFLDEARGHGLGECGLDLVVDEEGREHALHFGRPPDFGSPRLDSA